MTTIHRPEDIIKGTTYQSTMFVDGYGYVYLGVKDYQGTKKGLVIIDAPEGESSWIGDYIPNDITNPIWKNGFLPIDTDWSME
jgi:hypothetical protein